MARVPLREVVTLGGLALQSEDCAIRAAVHHRQEHGGLARVENERHHQFIIWRAVLPVWHAELERHGNTDLTLTCGGIRHHFEFKNWTGSTGERQLPMIQSDIRKVQAHNHGYIVITSLNPENDTDSNLLFLLSRVVGLDDTRREEFRFRTVGLQRQPIEFWVIGWPVVKVLDPSAPLTAAAPASVDARIVGSGHFSNERS